jgi:hypothetical protein
MIITAGQRWKFYNNGAHKAYVNGNVICEVESVSTVGRYAAKVRVVQLIGINLDFDINEKFHADFDDGVWSLLAGQEVPVS